MSLLIHPKCMYLFIRNVFTYSSEMYVLTKIMKRQSDPNGAPCEGCHTMFN